MRFYDAHNHLQDDRFGGCQSSLLAACSQVGVVRMVVNGSCEADWPHVRALAAQCPQVLPSFGCHPWSVPQRSALWKETWLRHLDRSPCAVGEIGLDRWKPGLSYDGQEEVFLAQFDVAAERNLPVSIHCLRAWGRLHDLLRSRPRPQRGFLLHSYGGPAEMVPTLADLGAYFGFPGAFARASKERRHTAFLAVPLDRLLVETDAPDQPLPPELDPLPMPRPATAPPSRELNHPANLPRIYRCLANLRRLSDDALAWQVEANFQRLFDR